ncbi:MAG TPA: hypothetical protein PKA33_04375 [Amaricoccus sp.]|jgi:hypothetical protein|uniref:hypothetical protein n=1 Tax=Amaricoccus sp. TaxID=1872485 RepID=UPI002CD2E2D2|nr:hypothetical protein [Amaricoccus sp.]HMR51707.1 hypothetical protein [Amaricoccus sp.]HMT98591.1 hypothetical protein [Amaricoccus sp.]
MSLGVSDPALAAAAPRGRGRPGLYLAVVLVAAVAAFAYHMRQAGIFACPADGYGEGRYLGYCQGSAYGDYDHGALWYGLEPETRAAAAAADVVLLGNSRLQFGLSTAALADWFAGAGASYYLLGFSHNENALFTAPLLADLHPSARAYVISVDKFFFDRPSSVAQEIQQGSPDTRSRYEGKRLWQGVHRAVCGALPALCGGQVSYFRDIGTGAWIMDGTEGIVPERIKFDRPVYDKASLAMMPQLIESAKAFLDGLDVDPSCVILTYIPSTQNNRILADELAAALGQEMIAPQGEGLVTIDGSHLQPASAETWSAAFLEAAGPRLRQCLDGGGAGAGSAS